MRALCVLLLFLLCGPGSAEIIELAPGEGIYCYAGPGARYEWRERHFIPREGLFSYFPGSEQPLLPVIYSPGPAKPGIVFSLLAALPEKLDAFGAELVDEEQASRARAKGFALESGEGIEVWSVLLGLPSDLPAGRYTLRLEGARGERRFQLLEPLEVQEAGFGYERLELSRALSELLTEEVEIRMEEARRLRELLLSVRPRSLYHAGAFTPPLRESVRTAGYGDRREYRFEDGEAAASIHNGVDLASPAGTEVLACGAGRVVLASRRLVTGNSVAIEHLPGVYTLSFHLQEIRVREGEDVRQEQVLGTVGATGLATGAHLHWELRVSGVAVDPDHYLTHPLIDKSLILDIMERILSREGR
jgi:murein DD-endopeptidase MepM/ murein hydrolase activator NlpD